MKFADLIAGTGVLLILLAFLLQTFKIMNSSSRAYLLLNLTGSGLACYGSYLIGSIPFMILEGVWCLVSMLGLLRLNNPGTNITQPS